MNHIKVLLVIGAMPVVFHTLLIALSCDARCNALWTSLLSQFANVVYVNHAIILMI